MNTEDRLRDAVTAYTDSIEPAPDAWRWIREGVDRTRARRRRPAWRLSLAGFATAIAIALVVALLALPGDDGQNGPPSIGSAPGAVPDRIVAVTGDGRVVVVDTTTGRELRTLADGVSAVPNIAVTPDGSRIFLHRATTEPMACESHELVTVAIEGGPVEVAAANALSPAISPDGTKLAYVSGNVCGGHRLVVRDLGTGSEQVWYAPNDQQLSRPSWAPDSRRLLLGVEEAPGSGSLQIFESGSTGSPVPVDPSIDGIAGYLGDTGLLLGVVLPPPESIVEDVEVEPSRAVAVDPATGKAVRDLFSIPGTVSEPFVSDSTGRHVLVRTGPDSDSEALYRWSEGEAGLTKVIDGIVAAAWIPDPSEPLSR